MATKKTSTKKTTRTAKTALAEPAKKLSQVHAAMQVLAQAKKPMNCKAMVEAMVNQGLWTSPAGKTPEATLYATILRDLRKGKNARFKKVDRGQFKLAGK